MHFKKYFPVFVFILFSLAAEEGQNLEEYTSFMDFGAPPSTIVGGVVNVLTGRYVETTTDYVSATANPINIERSYSNGTKMLGYLHGYSDLNISGTAYYLKKEIYEATVIEDGVKLKYYAGTNTNNHYLPIETLNSSISNTAPAKISGHVNYKSRCWMGKYVTPIVRNGLTFSYYGYEHCPNHYFRTQVLHPTDCRHLYGYDDMRVNNVKSVDSNGKLLAELKVVDHPFSFSGMGRIELIGDEGKTLTYHLSLCAEINGYKRCNVSRVESNFQPSIEYEYQPRPYKDKPHLLTKKILPEGRFLEVVYSDDPKRKKRVEVLKAPIGTDESAIPMYTFEYLKKKTNVWDAIGNRTSYFKNKDRRLVRINHHYNNDNLYRSEVLCWGSHGKRKDPTFLRSRHLVGSHGTVYMSKRFLNDEKGDVIEESLYGNLTGNGPLRNDVHETSGEKYKVHYTYSLHNVKTESKSVGQKSNIQTIEYDYYGQTSLVQLKTVSDFKKVRERYYYEYDPCGVAVLEIIDDGSSRDIEDFEGVTQRTIKRVQLSDRGLPVEEINSYIDLSTSHEIQLSRVVIHYSDWGHVLQKDYFDGDDRYAFSESWSYNAYGWVTEETDRSGRVTYYDYDGVGNCIRKLVPHQECEILSTYDYSNRLIKEEERHDDGRVLTKSYAYDLKGNRTLEVDPFGHEIAYKYDEFNRVISKTLPSIRDPQGKPVSGTERYEYDVMNHLKYKYDVNGKKTRIYTTAYGKPYKIVHPDKTTEKVVYFLDGSVNYTTDSQGTKTHFIYDYKGRKISEIKVSKRNKILSCKQWKYSAFQLLEEIDAWGNVTTYHYNGAGQLMMTCKGDAETHLVYDSLGREIERWEKSGEQSFRITKVMYDLLDQVIEERVEDEQGNLFLLKEYVYDAWGNCVCESTHGTHSISSTLTQYNSSGLPIRTLLPDGSETLFHYDTDYINSHGQNVLSTLAIDAKGNVHEVVYDTRNQITCEETKNTYSETVQKTKHFYDQAGHLILKSENVIVDGEILREHRTAFDYDVRGREIAVIEAMGEPEQKITRRTYTDFGEVEEIFRPNGIILYHQYDLLSRLSRLTSSDETVDYAYTYDQNDNIVDVVDHLTSSHTKRSYDVHGHVVEEELAHGFALSYAYDPMGRLTYVELPDSSTIEYGYDAEHLREIKRGSFVHRDHYDLSGKRDFTVLMNGLGDIHYTYDECLRPVSIDSPYLTSVLSYDRIGNVVALDQDDAEGRYYRHFEYDDLNQITSDDEHEYSYDSLGNRLLLDGVNSEVNVLNQLLSDGRNEYTYDFNGNLISKNSQQYAYDALDRLIETVNGGQRTTYAYDPFHRRLSKTHYTFRDQRWEEISTERYIYQGDKEVGVVDSTGHFVQLRVMGVGVGGDVGAAVLMELEGESYVPLHDYRGNVSVLVHAFTGEIAESYRFDGFGVETVFSEGFKNPWRFSSKRVDEETGWSYFGARYYDSECGRWTTPDPMWFVDGTHLYCYVRNNPTMFIDPEGLFLEALKGFIDATAGSVFEFRSDFYDVNGEIPQGYEVVPTSHDFSFDHRSILLRPEDEVGYGSFHIGVNNGILNSLEDAIEFHKLISQMAPNSTSSCNYNSTHGGWDIVEAGLNLLGMNSKPVTQLHHDWDTFFSNATEDSSYLQVAHSQGVIQVRNALKSYEPELRKKIHVIAIAPAAYINQNLCGSVMHYVSKRDFVPWLDLPGRFINRKNIKSLDPHPESALLDHTVHSLTVRDEIEARILWVRQNHGDLRAK